MQEKFNQAFVSIGLPIELAKITICDRPDLADYQCTGALAAARLLKKSPKDIADQIIGLIEQDGFTLTNVGAGYINIMLSDDLLLERVAEDIPDIGKGRTVIVDMGGPNVAKPMHVGHLRSLVIGESISRLYRHLGYNVLKDIHYGDWGFQMGLLLAEGFSFTSVEELMDVYPRLAQRAKDDPEFRKKAQQAVVLLQQNDPQMFARWKKIVQLSVKSVKSDTDYLGVTFDLEFGESDSFQYMDDTMLLLANALRESDGASVIDTQNGVLVFRNSEGGYLYGATDLATIVMRRKWKPEEIIYVVDNRQADYFKQVFEIAYEYGLSNGAALTHVGFGTVNGPDGKPFKTRAGGVPKLADMMADALELAFNEKPDLDIANKVAFSAIKFADLINDRAANYTYDPVASSRYEGKTGPYLLYQVVRMRSILRAASIEPGKIAINNETRMLVFALSRFNEVVFRSFKELAPHHLAGYLYGLAKLFSSFYANGIVLKESPSGLALTKTVLEKLVRGLDLLGIKTLERM